MSQFHFNEDDIEFALAQVRRLLMQGASTAHATNGGFTGPNLCVLVLTGPQARKFGKAASQAVQMLMDMTHGPAASSELIPLIRPTKTDEDPRRN